MLIYNPAEVLMALSEITPLAWFKNRIKSQEEGRRRGRYSLGRRYSDLEDMFNDFLGVSSMLPLKIIERDSDIFAPDLDLIEYKNNYVVKVDLPGLKKEDIDISLSKGMLIIKGEKKQEREENNEQYYRQERAYGAFCESLSLPGDVKESEITADFKDGVLCIVIPKEQKSEEQVQKIALK
jgi:HSP20 family protein